MAQELLARLRPHAQGVYLMPSFGRYEVAAEVLDWRRHAASDRGTTACRLPVCCNRCRRLARLAGRFRVVLNHQRGAFPMVAQLIRSIESEQFKDDIPYFGPGDTVRVHAKVVEGTRERIQVFEGVVIRRRAGGINENFTVRRIARTASASSAHS